MTRKKQTPLAVSKNGRILFVELKYVMNPFCALIDGLPLYFFGKSRRAYIKVTQAIRWQRKELEDSHGRSGSRECLDALLEILHKFRRGEVVEQ